MHPSRPRTLGSPEVKQARLGQLHTEPRVRELNAWVDAEGAKHGLSIPWFDPDDGGREAHILFLLESPGPKADAGKGSGIISVDNDDPTAKNLWTFREQAHLDGTVGLHWNIVPWYLSGGKPTTSDIQRGAGMLLAMLDFIPHLDVVVPMGRDAQRGWLLCQQKLRRRGLLATVPTVHPSSLGLAKPGRRRAVQRTLIGVSAYLDSVCPTPPESLQPRRSDMIRDLPKQAIQKASDLRRRGLGRFRSEHLGSSA